MAYVDYYQVLGIAPTAPDEIIKKAYRRLVLQFHPDRHQGKPEFQGKIRQINIAYGVLGNPDSRQSYDRLRLGGIRRQSVEPAADEVGSPNPAIILEAMETTLADEGRKEVFGFMMKNIQRVKAELAEIRDRTVTMQGYDSFRVDVVRKRALEVMSALLTAEMEDQQVRLLDVALQMLISQGVGLAGDDNAESLRQHLTQAFTRGRLDGYQEACELFYVRR